MSESKEIIPAKFCYEHIGGKLGDLLAQALVKKGWIVKARPQDKHYYVTELGQKEFTKLGVDLSQIKREEWMFS